MASPARWLVVILIMTRCVLAQETVRITGDRLGGFVLPVEPLEGAITLSGLRADAWTVDDTKRLLIEGDVRVQIAGYAFEGDRAVVWLNRLPSAGGLINQIAVFFDSVHDPASESGLGVSGRDLLITGSARGPVDLHVGGLTPDSPSRDPLVLQGEARLAEHLKTLIVDPPPLGVRPLVQAPPPPPSFRPTPGGTVTEADLALPEEIELPVPRRAPWLLAPDAVMRFAGGRAELVPGELENTIAITDGLTIEYLSREVEDELSQLSLSARSAVIFTDPGSVEEIARGELDTQSVRGVYLEGNVIATTNAGEYVMRSPRAYYDFRTGQAIMLDAVLRTYSRAAQLPVYARASEVRQIAERQWEARQVRATTSEFAVGHIALGAERMTVTQRPSTSGGSGAAAGDGPLETHFVSEENTLRVVGIPVIYWPKFSGTASDVPLRGVNVSSEDSYDFGIETRWDLYSLLGKEQPDGVDAELALDGYFGRGPAGGLDVTYDVPAGTGELDLYGFYDTGGDDRTSSGIDVEIEESFRGVALWEHNTLDLGEHWSLQAQIAYISDETYISTWREEDFADRREYETSFYLKNQHRNTAFNLLTSYHINDFISNDYLLASRAYTVDKLPEVTFRQYGISWFDEHVTYSGETRASRMRMRLETGTPNELGVRGAAFGLPNNADIEDALKATGLPTEYVNRFDTRHELSMPMTHGNFKIVPYVVGRITAYDNDFEDFSSDADDVRFFGAAGFTISTQFAKVDDGVENLVLDLHRLRHIVEPSMTLWYGYASVDQADLPVFDESVESLGDGPALRLALRNTWQTQRGGPGRWRSVDVFTLDTSVVLLNDEDEIESPTPQFFDYRPEYSQFGDHFYVAGQWLLSDTLSLTGRTTYDFEENTIARGSVGAELRHSPVLTTFIEYRFIEADDNELLELGWLYQLTAKYRINLRPQWDLVEDEFRAVSFTVVRSFPDFDLSVRVRRDEIRDETTFGASIDLVEF